MSRMFKVYVYAICKNEEQFVDRWMDSMSEADGVVVTDTGSCDGTVAKLQARGAQVYREHVEPWRFDTARNLSLSHVPADADICVCTDLDEVFTPGWREQLERAWPRRNDIDKVCYYGRNAYIWRFNVDNTPDIQFNCEKIHGRDGFYWRYPVHECLCPTGAFPSESIWINGITLKHYPDANKSRSSYLLLLEMAIVEAPLDERMRYYLGREYMYKGRWRDCISALTCYVTLPSARWAEERCAAMRWIAVSYYHLKEREEAYRWYFRALAEMPAMRDAYVEFAQVARVYGDWAAVFFLTEEALKIKQKSETYINMGYAWDKTLLDLNAAARLMMINEGAKKRLS